MTAVILQQRRIALFCLNGNRNYTGVSFPDDDSHVVMVSTPDLDGYTDTIHAGGMEKDRYATSYL